MKPMTLKQFRRLLWVSIALAVLSSAVPHRGVPTAVETAFVAQVKSVLATLPGSVALLAGIGLLLAGFVGMFQGRRNAPYVFLASVVFAHLVAPLFGWVALSGWSYLADAINTMWTGIVFAIAVFGPARHLFDGSSRSPRSNDSAV